MLFMLHLSVILIREVARQVELASVSLCLCASVALFSFLLGRLLRRRQGLDPCEQGVVLLALADGDADLVAQAGLVPVADENSLLLQAKVYVAAAAIRRAGEDEVGLALGHRPAEL